MNAPEDLETALAVQQFVAAEAELLNRGDWKAWLTLFSADSVYWMPLSPDQTDWESQVSLLCDDALLRELKCRRWYDRHHETGAMSLKPDIRSLRLISTLSVSSLSGRDGPELLASGGVTLAEFSRGEVRTHFARVTWRLRRNAASFSILEKRVDLLNAQGPLSDIVTYF